MSEGCRKTVCMFNTMNATTTTTATTSDSNTACAATTTDNNIATNTFPPTHFHHHRQHQHDKRKFRFYQRRQIVIDSIRSCVLKHARPDRIKRIITAERKNDSIKYHAGHFTRHVKKYNI